MKTICKLGLPALLILFAIWSAAFAARPNYHLVKVVSLPGNTGWDYLTLDSASRRLYITRGDHLLVVNVDTGKVIGTIDGLNGIHGVAIDPHTRSGYISNGRSNNVVMFSLATLKKVKAIPVGQGPDAIIYDPVTSRVFTFDGKSHTSTVIDTRSNSVVGSIGLPGKPEFPQADGKGHIYDNIEDMNQVVAINTRSMKVEASWPTAPGESPSGMAVDPAHHRVFSVCDNKLMTVINTNTGKVVATPPIGNGPDATAFDASDRWIFSPNGKDGTLTVIREDSPDQYSVIDTAATRQGARTMAFDPVTRRVLTVTARAIPPQPGDIPHTRHYVPGSCVLLEYAP